MRSLRIIEIPVVDLGMRMWHVLSYNHVTMLPSNIASTPFTEKLHAKIQTVR
jgi:hypothetical protein